MKDVCTCVWVFQQLRPLIDCLFFLFCFTKTKKRTMRALVHVIHGGPIPLGGSSRCVVEERVARIRINFLGPARKEIVGGRGNGHYRPGSHGRLGLWLGHRDGCRGRLVERLRGRRRQIVVRAHNGNG